MPTGTFHYESAFCRNLGWLTEVEQQILRTKKIAIAGLGGVGGLHLLTLTRLGIAQFHIADKDQFELANFNRQVGASVSTLNCTKADVMEQLAKDINPELMIQKFADNITEHTIPAFLEGVDLYVDSLDFFELEIREKIFAYCAENNIPAITAAPLGMGTGYLIFMPKGMRFRDYFAFSEGQSLLQKSLLFLIGLSPKAPHRAYLVDPSRIDLKHQRSPSTIIGCELAAAIVGAEAIKILLQRGPIKAAPYFHYFDAYLQRYRCGKLRFGNRGWMQRFKYWALQKFLLNKTPSAFLHLPINSVSSMATDIEKILDLARWAPSGDNSQPWRFEKSSDHEIIIYIAAQKNVYDLTYQGVWWSIGTLIENIAIAAEQFGLRIEYHYITHEIDAGKLKLQFHKNLDSETTRYNQSLAHFIPLRSVNRYSYKLRPLLETHKKTLQTILPEFFSVHWFEGWKNKWNFGCLNALTTHIRLTIPEAFPVHQRMIDWENYLSKDAMPSASLPIDTLTQKIMRWSLQKWKRAKLLNRLGGTLISKIQLDYVPALFSGAHFLWTVPKDTECTPEFYINAGRALQRFWLEATRLGLVIQPTYAAIAFADYAQNFIDFTRDRKMKECAHQLSEKLTALIPGQKIIFAGRIGYPASSVVQARSIRHPLAVLWF